MGVCFSQIEAASVFSLKGLKRLLSRRLGGKEELVLRASSPCGPCSACRTRVGTGVVATVNAVQRQRRQ